VIETARYGRVLALEQPEPGATRPYLLHCLDKTMRYTTSTSRALSHAIKELETIQAARKAREDSASSTDWETAPQPTQANEEQAEQKGTKNALGDTSALAEPEDTLGKDEAA